MVGLSYLHDTINVGAATELIPENLRGSLTGDILTGSIYAGYTAVHNFPVLLRGLLIVQSC